MDIGGYDYGDDNDWKTAVPDLHLFVYNGTGYQLQQMVEHVPAGTSVAISGTGNDIVSGNMMHKDFAGAVGVLE